ncbi:MAG: hypothetical protein MJ231_07215 [bacterium]|nr:hypothetical protein [bacterium]
MSLVIDANMKLLCDRMHITSSRMIRDYGLSTVDEVIEEEAKKGNSHAVSYAREYYHSPEKLIRIFELTNPENKYKIIYHMDDHTKAKVLPLLKPEDLVMGLYFFKQERLLQFMMNVDIEELVNVIKAKFPLEQLVQMFTEADLAYFFMQDQLDRNVVMEQLKSLPQDVLQQFVEGVTGQPYKDADVQGLFSSMEQLPDDKFHKFMAAIDPEVQRQLVFQMTQENNDYLTLFPNITYVNMLEQLPKQDMVAPMVMLNQETLINMISELPENLIAIVASQVDTHEFAKLLQHGNMRWIEDAMMI